MSKFLKKIFNFRNKVNSNSSKSEKLSNEGIKINIKGQRVADSLDGPNLNLTHLDSDIFKKDRGPPMLNTRTRMKVWMAMGGVVLYFYLCYRLIIFRLKADDLDLMEREVNDEFKLKTKISKLNKNINLSKN